MSAMGVTAMFRKGNEMHTWRLVFEGRDYGTVRADTRAKALYLLHFRLDATVGRRWYEAGRPVRIGGRVVTDRDMDADAPVVAGADQLSFAGVLK